MAAAGVVALHYSKELAVQAVLAAVVMGLPGAVAPQRTAQTALVAAAVAQATGQLAQAATASLLSGSRRKAEGRLPAAR